MPYAGKNPDQTSPEYAKGLGVAGKPRVLFDGSPSQAVNAPKMVLGLLALCGVWWLRVGLHAPYVILLAAAVVAAAYVLNAVVQTSFIVYTIDVERIHVRSGIAMRQIKSLELFRVQDVTLLQPWWQEMFKIGTVRLDSSDQITPRLFLLGMADAVELRDSLNKAAIELRQRMGIREVNFGKA